MKKSCLVILVVIGSFPILHGQPMRERIFQSIGFTSCVDYITSPVTTGLYMDVFTGEEVMAYNQAVGFSLFTAIYDLRFNLLQLSPEAAISLSVRPAAGLTIRIGDQETYEDNSSGFGSFNLPILLKLDFGAGSTYDARSIMGGALGFGVEYTQYPIFGLKKANEEYHGISLKNTWLQPVVNAGFKFSYPGGQMGEMSFKVGYSPKSDYRPSAESPLTQKGALSLQLAFLFLLNYY